MIHIDQIMWEGYNRSHERSSEAITFSISGKPDSRILLLQDLDYERSFDYHIEGGESLRDSELDELVKYIVCFIQPGYYLLVCGENSDQLWRLYWKFYCYTGKLKDTGCVRVLQCKNGQVKTYKTFQKL